MFGGLAGAAMAPEGAKAMAPAPRKRRRETPELEPMSITSPGSFAPAAKNANLSSHFNSNLGRTGEKSRVRHASPGEPANLTKRGPCDDELIPAAGVAAQIVCRLYRIAYPKASK